MFWNLRNGCYCKCKARSPCSGPILVRSLRPSSDLRGSRLQRGSAIKLNNPTCQLRVYEQHCLRNAILILVTYCYVYTHSTNVFGYRYPNYSGGKKTSQQQSFFLWLSLCTLISPVLDINSSQRSIRKLSNFWIYYWDFARQVFYRLKRELQESSRPSRHSTRLGVETLVHVTDVRMGRADGKLGTQEMEVICFLNPSIIFLFSPHHMYKSSFE